MKHQPIPSPQLSEFRLLTDVHGQNLLNNDRPVQPINNRTIYVSSGAIHPVQSALLSIVCLIFVLKI
jgi:Eukaryotic-type carbonic anhydrase